MPPIPEQYFRRKRYRPAQKAPDGIMGGHALCPPVKYVYCLVDSTFTRVKFGTHKHDPRGRLRCKALQTGSPHRLYLLAFTDNLLFPEGVILRRYFPLNPEGGGREWRPLTVTLVKDVCEMYVWTWKDEKVLSWVRAALLRRDLGL